MNKTLLILGIVAAATAAGLLAYHYSHSSSSPDDDIPMIDKSEMTTGEYQSWLTWQNKHGKKYASKDVDFRLSVYHFNYKKVMNHRQDATYTMELNEFADLSPKEFKKFYLGYKGANKKLNLNKKIARFDASSTPSSVDWRTASNPAIVTPIKNQGQCGSCWAFSTTGSVEGLYAQTMEKSKTFSEQQLVDCSSNYGNEGCNGGLMDDAFQYVESKGLETEGQYPYEGVTGTCEYAANGDFKIGGYQDVSQSESALKAAIAIRPVSIAVDAEAWSFYSGGIFSDCGTSLDHGVLAVGYTDDYWIVKNSWGASWGESGFIRLAMGNTCGILNSASYPTA